VLALAQFMVVLDVTIVNVALPSIQDALGFSADGLQWVINAYTLTFGGLLMLGGRMSDLLGRRRVFLAGMVLFALASLVAGLAGSAGVLVTARAVQGVGAALLSPAALALVTVTFPAGSERNLALGIWGALAGIGGTLGVVAGGILVDSLGWEWIFFVNLPVAAIALIATPFVVGESRGEIRHQDYAFSLAAFSRTSSRVPARKNACSGRVSALPSRISLNDATVSLTDTYLPGRPVKTSATVNGWLMNRCRRRARATVALSSSDSSSMPRIAMMSCRSR